MYALSNLCLSVSQSLLCHHVGHNRNIRATPDLKLSVGWRILVSLEQASLPLRGEVEGLAVARRRPNAQRQQ